MSIKQRNYIAEFVLAQQICGCANTSERRRDVEAILAYGDQREREALEKAEKAATDALMCQSSVSDAILALIPKDQPHGS